MESDTLIIKGLAKYVNFGTKKIGVLYKPTYEFFEVGLRESEFRSGTISLYGIARYVEITGRFQIDDDRNPTKLIRQGQVKFIDCEGTINITDEFLKKYETPLKLKENKELNFDYKLCDDTEQFFVVDERKSDWSFYSFGQTIEELERDIAMQIIGNWEHCVNHSNIHNKNSEAAKLGNLLQSYFVINMDNYNKPYDKEKLELYMHKLHYGICLPLYLKITFFPSEFPDELLYEPKRLFYMLGNEFLLMGSEGYKPSIKTLFRINSVFDSIDDILSHRQNKNEPTEKISNLPLTAGRIYDTIKKLLTRLRDFIYGTDNFKDVYHKM